MPQKRLSMRKIRETLRYRNTTDLSLEGIAQALKLSKGVVVKYLRLAQAAGLTWPLPEELDDAALERLLFQTSSPQLTKYITPDYAVIHRELRKKGVTLQLLWEEYRQRVGNAAYRYTAFCNHYRDWAGSLKRSMRQVHRAGEKLFVDYAGPTVPIVQAASGEIQQASIFVAVLGASSYTYACATAGQAQADWLTSIGLALRYMGGVTELIVPDNPRALIKDANRYEPLLNRGAEEWADHYGTVILPARPRHPQDKAKVEVGVQVVERWILAALRHRRFFSLVELNAAIADLLIALNARPFKKLPGCRRSAFETLDAPYLKPLPATPFEQAEWKRVRVNINYHVEFESHAYSVPHALVRQEVELRVTPSTLEVLAHGKRVASHPRSVLKGEATTVLDHMPSAHRAHAEWSPEKLMVWASALGVATGELVKRLLQEKKHPEQGYRSCLGLMRLARTVGDARLEAACARTLSIGAHSFRSVDSILKKGLDRQPVTPAVQVDSPSLEHDNVRGPTYYH